MKDQWIRVYDAVRKLAGVCDWANSPDGQGFSATDASIGHFLAELPLDRWEEAHLIAALEILPTYRRQLGITHISELYEGTPPSRAAAAAARATVVGQARAHRRQQRRRRDSSVTISDGRVVLRFPYDADLVRTAQGIPGRRYDADTKANSYPLSSLPAVVAFAEAAGIPIDAAVREQLARVIAEPDQFTPVHVTVDSGDPAALVIRADYSPALNTGLREANGGSSTWDPASRVHRVRVDCANAAGLRELFDTHGLRVAEGAAELLGQHAAAGGDINHVVLNADGLIEFVALPMSKRRQIARDVRELAGSTAPRYSAGAAGRPLTIGVYVAPRGVLKLADTYGLTVSEPAREALLCEAARQDANLQRSIAVDGPEIQIDGLGVTLLPHQHAGVGYALDQRALIVADEMGLGKTALSLATAAAADVDGPIVVACKPDLVENWIAEIAKVLPGRRVYAARGMTAQPIPEDAEIVVIGLAALASRAKQQPGSAEQFVWVDEILKRAPGVFIVDEGHLGKEASAARSRAMARIGIDVSSRNGLVLDLTGTPLVNRPRELAQQLVTLGVLAPKDKPAQPRHLFGEYGAFLFRYCGPQQDPQGYGWTFTGHSHTEELHHRLRAWGLYLRRGQEALTLPSFEMRVLTIPAADLDPAAMSRYRAAESNVRQYLVEEAQGIAAKIGEPIDSAAVRSLMNANNAEHLKKLNALRQILGKAKMPVISRWVAQQIANGEKVMIAAHHRAVVSGYAKQFGGLKIQGGQSGPEKEADKHAFQTQPIDTAPTITVATGAGGVGHTLTAARIGIQAELCWTPGERNQMAKRIHRIGQTRPVTYYVAVVPGTVDEKMWQMLERKQRILGAVLDGEQLFDDGEQAGAAEIAWEYATEPTAGARVA